MADRMEVKKSDREDGSCMCCSFDEGNSRSIFNILLGTDIKRQSVSIRLCTNHVKELISELKEELK